jgi:hypothetical protein
MDYLDNNDDEMVSNLDAEFNSNIHTFNSDDSWIEYLDNNDLSDIDTEFSLLNNKEPAPGVMSDRKMKEYIMVPKSARVPELRKFLRTAKIPCNKSKEAKLISDIKLYFQNKYGN